MTIMLLFLDYIFLRHAVIHPEYLSITWTHTTINEFENADVIPERKYKNITEK